MAKPKAIALCRVSSQKQRLEGSSLEAQEVRVYKCAAYLDVEIEKLWSHDTSSRKGKNLARKDLHEMFDFAKGDRSIKYIIVDEADRFMRSMEEAYWWKVQFSTINVKLAYANMPEITHEDNPMSVMREMMAFFQAEASNHERITKTTDKMQAKIMAGYYPGMVHQGYRTSNIKALHIPREPQWSLLKESMRKILYESITLDEALIWLNDNGYRLQGGGLLDMWKLKRILREPYYAGIIKMSKWDTVCNQGLHQAMITPDEHIRLLEVVGGKGKKFKAQQYNPNFKASNIVECTECIRESRPQTKLVGYRHHNNKPLPIRKFYERYRCRGCGKNILKKELHDELDRLFDDVELANTEDGTFMESLRHAWKTTVVDNQQSSARLKQRMQKLIIEKDALVRAMVASPEYADDIKTSISSIKSEIDTAEIEIDKLSSVEDDFERFTDFAIEYADNIRLNWWNTENPADRIRFKQLVFLDNLSVSRQGKVLTPALSPIYRYKTTKKTSENVNSVEIISSGGPGGT